MGRPIPHLSGDVHTTGEAKYTSDIKVAGKRFHSFMSISLLLFVASPSQSSSVVQYHLVVIMEVLLRYDACAGTLTYFRVYLLLLFEITKNEAKFMNC